MIDTICQWDITLDMRCIDLWWNRCQESLCMILMELTGMHLHHIGILIVLSWSEIQDILGIVRWRECILGCIHQCTNLLLILFQCNLSKSIHQCIPYRNILKSTQYQSILMLLLLMRNYKRKQNKLQANLKVRRRLLHWMLQWKTTQNHPIKRLNLERSIILQFLLSMINRLGYLSQKRNKRNKFQQLLLKQSLSQSSNQCRK